MEAYLCLRIKQFPVAITLPAVTLRLFCKASEPKLSQRGLADRMQLEGIDLDKNAIQRIESGQRFVTDIELKVFGTDLPCIL